METKKYKIEHIASLGPITTDSKGNLSIVGVINSKISIVPKPLKRLVAIAGINGQLGYSYNEEDIKKR
ncbi:MAG: hypothetical protein K2Y30_01980 [Flavobacteriaceae bacterium]|nr:hypothetical protein [Flavobacteriaceae bacterium]